MIVQIKSSGIFSNWLLTLNCVTGNFLMSAVEQEQFIWIVSPCIS